MSSVLFCCRDDASSGLQVVNDVREQANDYRLGEEAGVALNCRPSSL